MKRIIVVEDNRDIQEAFRLILERAGFEVFIYSEGASLLNNEFEPPDLFIIDKLLSGIDGLDVCRFLKQQESTRLIPVIMTSASPYIQRMVKDAGADDFFEKPFKKSSLLELVNKYIN